MFLVEALDHIVVVDHIVAAALGGGDFVHPLSDYLAVALGHLKGDEECDGHAGEVDDAVYVADGQEDDDHEDDHPDGDLQEAEDIVEGAVEAGGELLRDANELALLLVLEEVEREAEYVGEARGEVVLLDARAEDCLEAVLGE